MDAEDAPKAKGSSRMIASRIRQEREQRAWTQSQVAERIGSTRINVSRWENGTTVPSLYYRQKLAELFEKDVQELGLVPDSNEDVSNEIDTSRSTPLWSIAHRRNPFFTGREEILNQIRTVFQSSQASGLVLALSGLGGVGKTQIALEYAYCYRDLYQAVFWVNAATRDTLNTDFIKLASLLALSKQQDQEEIIIRAVKHWLTANTGWLLILDNVDSLETVLDFLPPYSAGDVLLTTRLQVLSTVAHNIEVAEMTGDEGVMFLLHRTKLLAPGLPLDQAAPDSQQEAAKIVNELAGLPLALDQAGAYIEETGCGLSQYLQRYHSHGKELLSRRGSYPINQPEINHPEPVATTWQLSFQAIEERWPTSAELLTFCAFLDADSIPEELLIRGAAQLGPTLSKAVDDPLKLDSVLEALHAYSLIRRSPETHSLSMHRLVQTILRQNLSLDTQKSWARCVVCTLNHVFPAVEIATWAQCQQLLPQVQVCVQLCDEFALFLPEAGHLFMRAGDYAYNRAMYAQAEVFFQKALTICKLVFSPQHLDIGRGLHYLGELYRVWGHYKDAESLFLQALTIYQHSLPPDHLDIANTLNDLGELYHNLGRYDEAEPLFQRALSMAERISGPDHPATITTLHYLARLYLSQQRYQEAERLYQRVLNAQERHFGPKHLEIAVTLNNLAILYRNQGDYIQAETLLKRALRIEEEMRGPDHPRTAIALHNLAVVYQKQKRYQEAEVIFQRALTIKETALGPAHLNTVKTATNLAHLYQMQKRYAEARVLLQRALNAELGENHPYMVVILRTLARLHFKEENYAEAETCYLHALAISEKVFPIGSSDMIIVLEALAELYRTLGREEEAISIEQRKIALKARSTF